MRISLMALILGLAVGASAYGQPPVRFHADLEGLNALGDPVPTMANGRARVEVIDDGTALNFRVDVTNIENLLMAHIHISPVPIEGNGFGQPAGPVAFWFTGGPPPQATVTERINGRMAEGFIITDGQLQTWDPVDPEAGTVEGLITAMSEGRASVVVHTDDLNPDTISGVQGDSRAGELRGTLRLVGGGARR